MALIERDDELGRLEAAIKDGMAGRGSTVLIEGPPGIGKSALLDHASRIAEGLGMRVLPASAAEFESGLAFAVIRSVLDRPLGELDAGDRAAVLAGAARLALGPLGLRNSAEGPVEPGAAIHGLYWLCANLADRRPLLLAIDDLHWADEPSLLFLSYLARRASEHPVVICGTTRPIANESAQRYLAAIADISSEVVRPAALSTHGVARMVDETFNVPAAAEFSHACAQVTGGNPYLLVQMLGTLDQDHVEPTAEEAGRLSVFGSAMLSRTLLSRVSRHGQEAKRVADAVAILGQDANLHRIASLANLDPDTVLLAVSGLRREGIFTLDGAIAFVHPLIRHALYSDVDEPARGRAHLRAAKLLGSDGDQARVASHLLAAERSADPWVVAQLREHAAAALGSGAPATAVELLTRALAEPCEPSARPALELDLGRALTRTGDLDSAAETLQHALLLVTEHGTRTEIALELGRALRHAGRLREAVAVLDEETRNLARDDTDGAMLFELEIAIAGQMGLAASEWVDRLADAVSRAHSSSLPDRAVRSLHAFVGAATGNADAAAVARLARSCSAPDGTIDPPFMLQGIAAGLGTSGSYGEALHHLDRALDIARQTGDVAQFEFASFTRTWVAHRAGRVLESMADAQVVLDAPLTSPPLRAYAAAHVIVALMERGSLDEADRLLTEHGLADASDGFGNVPGTAVLLARGRLRHLMGRPDAAVEDFNQCRDVLQETGFTAPAFGPIREYSASAHLALGERDRAREIAVEDVELSRAFAAPRELGVALRSLGLVEGGRRGIELLDESVDVLADSEAVLDHAKSLVEHGAALRRAGKSSHALDPLRHGLDLASRCGALVVADRAREELVAAGARPRRERLSGPDSLTASELRVARMAAEGRSNPEIAQALFVTRRTVEVHLTHAYRKLGISSRDALTAALEEPSPE